MHKIQTGLSNSTKTVIQYDKKMNKLNEFYSIAEAVKILNLTKRIVIDSCKGRSKNKSGFLFRYAE
jgi:hypothetical protein